ncbi:LacI family DNA-binding transcriptional regulator [Sphingomonas bisphenolicum]|uniref:LacI family transcriptional regulator n=1 Tax=Sphingomonas bisphenolicum TaxID=296544 RepID=A0ABN5WN46_9SPHN|nr:LacI family DNA-binding transcriptional regulator [Sphingomonas bisphenolicum]BBF71735.1 LacI family transcriptional regulator [Sphingomonas bisphenolicum]
MPDNDPSTGGNEPTIVDVAALAGVSIRTVSRVLNQSPKVNKETRARIQDAIDALNFRPSLRARALAKGRSFLIGMVHNDRNALVLDSVQRGVGREATRRGYEVICHSVPVGDPGAGQDVLGFCRRARVDGLVVMPPVSDMAGLPAALQADHIPAVAISAVPIEGYGAVLLSQERQAAGDVARHLLALGHRRIAMITGPQDMISAIERRAGFVEALEEAGVGPPVEVEGDYSLAAGMTAAGRLLAISPTPTAIFAANDIMAAGVLKIAAARGIAVPDALSVVGFDGSIVAEMLTPSLTTVARPFGEMAEMATRHLIDLIEGQTPCDLDSPVLSLVPAQSSGPSTDPSDSGPSSP